MKHDPMAATPAGRAGALPGPVLPGRIGPRARSQEREAAVRRKGASRASWFPRDPFRLGLALYVFLSISRIHQYVPSIGAIRPAQILFILLVAYVFLAPGCVRWSNLWKPWTAKVLAALVACALLSIPFGISLGNSAASFLNAYAKTLALAGLLLVGIRDWRDLKLLVWAYVLAVGYQTYMALFVVDTLVAASGIERIETAIMYDSNDLALLMLVGLPFALLTFETSGKLGKVLSILLMLAIPAAIAKTGSRGGFIGFTAVGVTLVLVMNHVAIVRRMAVVVVSGVALALAAPPGYWTQMATILNLEEDYNVTTVDGRWGITKRGIGYVLDYPLFGLGINNFSRAEGMLAVDKLGPASAGRGVRWAAPHNTYLQVAADMGLPALVFWLVLLGGIFFASLSRRRRVVRPDKRSPPPHRFLYKGLTYLPAAVVGFAVPSAFLSFAYLDPFYILIALSTGLFLAVDHALAWERRELSGDRVRGRPNPRRASPI